MAFTTIVGAWDDYFRVAVVANIGSGQLSYSTATVRQGLSGVRLCVSTRNEHVGDLRRIAG